MSWNKRKTKTLMLFTFIKMNWNIFISLLFFFLHSSLILFNHHLDVEREVVPDKDTVNQWWPNQNSHTKSELFFFCCQHLLPRIWFYLKRLFFNYVCFIVIFSMLLTIHQEVNKLLEKKKSYGLY